MTERLSLIMYRFASLELFNGMSAAWSKGLEGAAWMGVF